mgnify:CR=1 FL=1
MENCGFDPVVFVIFLYFDFYIKKYGVQIERRIILLLISQLCKEEER